MSNPWPLSPAESGVRGSATHVSHTLCSADASQTHFIDQDLGYAGQDRFVLFYYDPHVHQMTWRDSRSSGSGCTTDSASLAGILAHARSLGINLGDDSALGDHVLLLDRVDHQACFAYREAAQEFLARRCDAAA